MPPEPPGPSNELRGLDAASRLLENFLLVVLGTAGVGVLIVAVVMIATMEAASRSQGGRFYVAVAAIVVLGAIETQVARVLQRRRRGRWRLDRSFHDPRVVIAATLTLVLSGILLIGLALYLP